LLWFVCFFASQPSLCSLTGAQAAQGALCLAPYAPLPPPWFLCRFDMNSVRLGVAGWIAAAVLSRSTLHLIGLVERTLPTIAGALARAPGSSHEPPSRSFELQDAPQEEQLVSARSDPLDLPLPDPPPPDDREHSTHVVKLGVLRESRAVFFAPLGEEVFFRGFLLPVLATAMPLAAAVAASSFLFALAHVVRSDYDPVYSTTQYVGFSVVMSLVTLAGQGNLAAPIIAHALFNAGLGVGYYFPYLLGSAGWWPAYVEHFAKALAVLDAAPPEFRLNMSAEMQACEDMILAERSRLAADAAPAQCAALEVAFARQFTVHTEDASSEGA